MKKQYNTIVLALSLLLLSINILNAQETSPFTYEITQPVCSPYGSISLTNSGAAIEKMTIPGIPNNYINNLVADKNNIMYSSLGTLDPMDENFI